MNVISKVGDVFLIPLDKKSAVGGQVLAIRENEELYIAVMGHPFRRDENDPEVAIAGEPVLLTLSFDAKLSNGDWPIIGNLANIVGRYPHPAFKVKHAGTMSIESRDKTIRRPASTHDLDILHNRSVASPMIIEDVIRAHLGLGKWSESYNKRRAEYALYSSELLLNYGDTSNYGDGSVNR